MTGPVESYVAIGDSFTEGVGDPGPDGTFVGWADRLAGLLAEQAPPGFRYANLAVRGRLLGPIVAGQVPRAAALAPDLVTFCAGGNDILRPGSDPDSLAEQYEKALAQLLARVGTVVVCTGFDTRGVPVLRHLRGKIATYNTHLWAVADRHHCPVLDLWSLRSLQQRDAWNEDRLHLSTLGHERVARRCAEVLGAGAAAAPSPVLSSAAPPARSRPAAGHRSSASARRDDLHWARHHLLPWIGRRLRGQSSGDHVEAKRPELLPL